MSTSGAKRRVRASVGIVTDDPAELLAFYGSGMGFALESTSEFPQGTVHRLRREEARVKLYAPSPGTTREPRPEPWFARAGIGYAALEVEDAGAAVAAARAAGGQVLAPPTSLRPGAICALVADPQGNVWEILQETRDG